MQEKRIRAEVIRVRVDKETKDLFNTICKDRCINQSELLRTLIERWMYEQNDVSLYRQRITDLEHFKK